MDSDQFQLLSRMFEVGHSRARIRNRFSHVNKGQENWSGSIRMSWKDFLVKGILGKYFDLSFRDTGNDQNWNPKLEIKMNKAARFPKERYLKMLPTAEGLWFFAEETICIREDHQKNHQKFFISTYLIYLLERNAACNCNSSDSTNCVECMQDYRKCEIRTASAWLLLNISLAFMTPIWFLCKGLAAAPQNQQTTAVMNCYPRLSQEQIFTFVCECTSNEIS